MDMKSILDLQKKVRLAMSQLQTEIQEQLEKIDDLPGVKPINSSVRATSVSMSAIVQNDYILDSYFYSRSEQI